MAKLVLGMNVSLDGYVDHIAFAPDAMLFRHFIDEAAERAFAAAWCKQPKHVVLRMLTYVPA